jgi:hypothetical protein
MTVYRTVAVASEPIRQNFAGLIPGCQGLNVLLVFLWSSILEIEVLSPVLVVLTHSA